MTMSFESRVSGLGSLQRTLLKSGIVLIVLALFVGFVGDTAAQDMRQKAEAEGQMVFYASFNANDSKTLIDGFKQLYPKIDATFYRATDAQLIERMLTEARAGRHLWDVMMTTSYYGHNLKKRGMLAPYDSPERKFYRDGYKDPQAMWTSIYTNYAAFGFNTRSVAKSSIPKSYAELLKPEWKGNIGMDSRPYEWFGTMLKALGDEKGFAYMRELAKQVQLRNGRTILAQLVAAGEFKGALTAYSQTFEQMKPAGAPVDWIYLNPVFANIHPTGLSAKAPHPNAGKLFIDFVLSKRGQELIRGMSRIPDRIDTPPEQSRFIEVSNPVFAPTEVLDEFERYAKMFHDIFGGR
jgi:iron(III) transport system substrate-binding protein